MSLGSRSVCWKLLSSVSEHETPKEFHSFYEAIKGTAIRKGFQQEASEGSLAESELQNQMVEAIGRSLQARPATLPAVGQTIRIQGEWWHVWLHVTQIPHLSAAVVEHRPQQFPQCRCQLVRELIKDQNADFGRLEDEQLQGKTWEMYLFCKIQKLALLRDAFSKRPFRSRPVLRPPNHVFPELNRALAPMSTIAGSPAEVRKFLDRCDGVLTEHVGRSGLAEYLRGSSISPKQFLEAQERNLLGRVFRL